MYHDIAIGARKESRCEVSGEELGELKEGQKRLEEDAESIRLDVLGQLKSCQSRSETDEAPKSVENAGIFNDFQ